MDKVLEASRRTIEALEYQIASHHLRIERQKVRIGEAEREGRTELAGHVQTVLKRMELVLVQAESDLRDAEERRDLRSKEKPHV